ncbi:MAG: hypothetical protein B6229_00135 [Spirochaetaceae bacterium 4572_7]|nr:MAG: hypothetical protein B6229_00135 [Spirochaetaceae bacterium 4572_7]
MFKSVAGIIKKENKFYLGKRKPGGSIGNKWEFPGGKVEPNESLTDALVREYLEELSVNITVKDFITTKPFKHNTQEFILHAFYVDLNSYNIKMNEHTEFNWFTLDELKALGDAMADSDRLLLNDIK